MNREQRHQKIAYRLDKILLRLGNGDIRDQIEQAELAYALTKLLNETIITSRIEEDFNDEIETCFEEAVRGLD